MGCYSGFVALLGLPNAGKSSFANACVGDKVSIVTDKPQTTRQSIRGIFTTDDTQVIFVDAPGFVRPSTKLNEFFGQEIQRISEDSDVLVATLNLDAEHPQKLIDVAQKVSEYQKNWFILITKADIGKPNRIDHLQRTLSDNHPGVPIVVTSALEEGAKELQEKITAVVKPFFEHQEQPLFSEDLFTSETSKSLVAETIREKCFELLKDEIPYELAVKVRRYDENQPNLTKVYAEIIVNKNSHVSIVVGNKGQLIKQIGIEARSEIEKLFGNKFYLELYVKVKQNWVKDKKQLKEMGYALQD